MNFFSSLRFKIAITTAILISLTVASILYFMSIENSKFLFEIHSKNAKNLLKATLINIENEFKGIEFYKNNILSSRKSELKDVISVAISNTNTFYLMYKKGILSEKQAKEYAIKSLSKIRYNNRTGYVWVNDTTRPYPKMIMHPTLPELNGKILDSPQFNCALGKKINLFKAFNDVTSKYGEGFVDYLWPKPTYNGLTKSQPKISFVKLFNPWNWIIGTGLYVDDIEAATKNKIDAVIKGLRESIPKMKFGETDYIFIFNSKLKMIVYPSYLGKGLIITNNPDTGNNILKDLMLAYNSGEKKLTYTWDKQEHKGEFRFKKISYIEYFEPLDWYIASSFYFDEINTPSTILTNKLIIIALIFMIIAFILTFFISKSLTKPLNNIIDVLSNTTMSNFNVRIDYFKKNEFGQLANYFNRFMEQIEISNIKLKKEINLTSKLIESSPAFIVALNISEQIMLVNSTMLKACGYELKEVIGKKYSEIFVPEDDMEDFKKRFRKNIDSANIHVHENYILTKSGDKILVEWHDDVILDENGEFNYQFGIGIDITDKKKAEEQLIQSQKMDIIGNLAGGLAHDFNNILGGIVSTLSIIKYKLQSNGEIELSELKEYLDIIEKSGDRAAGVVKQLLTISRKQEINTVYTDLNDIIKNVVRIAENSFDKSVSIQPKYSSKPAIVSADPIQLEQVLLNFCVNSAHALTIMKDKDSIWGGVIELSLEFIKYDSRYFKIGKGNQDYWMLSVNDNGVGIPKDKLDEIFNPFFTTKEKGMGTGLGLSMVYNILKQHNAFIDIYSEVGVGTSFKVYFPAANVKNTALSYKISDKIIIPKSSGLVLVVDDEKVMRDNAKIILEECGFSVLVAENGKRALELYKLYSNKIVGVVLDLAMPEMSGKETYIKLQEIKKDINVILTSGFKNDERVSEALSLGIKAFIEKPYTISELANITTKIFK